MALIVSIISHFGITPIALILFYIVLEQYPELAHAFPCIGDDAKEYCTGYRAGAIQAKADYKTGHDLDIDQHVQIILSIVVVILEVIMMKQTF